MQYRRDDTNGATIPLNVRQQSHTLAAHGQDRPEDLQLAQASEAFRRRVDKLFGRSLHIRHIDTGSCNACESEIKLLTSPYYDIHRLGLFFTPSPRHADLLLVTGPITQSMEGPLRRTYEAMPDPRRVVAVGACACSGGVFARSPLVRGSLHEILPVDVFIPGWPPSPLALIQGLLLAVNRANQRIHSGVWYATSASQPIARGYSRAQVRGDATTTHPMHAQEGHQ
jgi:Ni,Fe-hydrogenase III small subunit